MYAYVCVSCLHRCPRKSEEVLDLPELELQAAVLGTKLESSARAASTLDLGATSQSPFTPPRCSVQDTVTQW